MVKTSVLISDYSHRSEDLQFFTLEALFKKYIIEQLMKAVARTGDVVSSSSSERCGVDSKGRIFIWKPWPLIPQRSIKQTPSTVNHT